MLFLDMNPRLWCSRLDVLDWVFSTGYSRLDVLDFSTLDFGALDFGLKTPAGKRSPSSFQGLITLTVVRLILFHKRPKLRRVVQLAGVAQFVNQDIAHQGRWQKQKMIVETDSLVAGTTGPACFLIANLDALVG